MPLPKPGTKVITYRYRVGFGDWIESEEIFLGITQPGDIYGRDAVAGIYQPLDVKTAKQKWAEYLTRRLRKVLGREVKPTWRDIEAAVEAGVSAGILLGGDEPYIIVEKNDKRYAMYYRFQGRWVHGSAAAPIRMKVVEGQ